MHFIKIKNFCSTKDIPKKMKIQATDGIYMTNVDIKMYVAKVSRLDHAQNAHKSIIKF